MTTRTPVPAVDGWFTVPTGDGHEAPALLGTRCPSCGTYSFPKASLFCPNPECDSSTFEEVPLSRTGTIWSYTDAHYQPPPPYMSPTTEHRPFAIAAVELADEGLVVMGQVVPEVGVDELSVGDPMELVLAPLYSDDGHEYLVWKWRPLAASHQAPDGEARP